MGPSSLLREEVYPVCSGPLIPLQRWGLPSVQWAPHPSWEMRFTQCAVGPSSLFRYEVYPVCSGPLISTKRCGSPSVQWTRHPFWEMKFIDFAVCPSSLTLPDRWDLPNVQWAPHSWLCFKDNPVCSGPLIPNLSWKMKFTQCATNPSSLLRDEVYLVRSGPLIPPEGLGLPSVQWTSHPSWEMRFIDCAVSPSSLTLPDR